MLLEIFVCLCNATAFIVCSAIQNQNQHYATITIALTYNDFFRILCRPMYAIRRMLFRVATTVSTSTIAFDRKFVNGIVFRYQGLTGIQHCACATLLFSTVPYVHCCPFSRRYGHLPARSKTRSCQKNGPQRHH